MSKDWKNSIRKSFEDYQVSEPDGLWDAVEKGLALDSRPMIATPLFWISSITAVAASLLAILYVDMSRNETLGKIYAEVSVDDNGKGNVPSSDSPLVAVADASMEEDVPIVAVESHISQSADAKEVENTISISENSDVSAVDPESANDSATIIDSPEATISTSEKSQVNSSDQNRQDTQDDATETYTEQEGYMDMEEYLRLIADEEERGFAGKFSLLASASNVMEDSRTHSNYGGFYGSDISNSISRNQYDSKPFMSYSRVLYENFDEEVVTEYDHSQPISFSLEAEYRLNKHLGIVSGLSYSRLSSKVKSGSDITNYRTVQKLDYIGIPLSMNFYFFQNKWAEIYMNAGGMLEKCIAGKSITTYNFDSSESHIGEKESISEKELQWSADASFGAHLRLYKDLKFFVEPGVSYHFNNASLVQNIYKERPCNFRFSVGLRYEIRK